MSESTQLRLFTLNDRELWLITHNEFVFPIYAETLSTEPDTTKAKPTHVRIVPAVLLNATEGDVVALSTQPYRITARGEDVIVPYDKLPLFAQRAPGTSPKYYYRGNTVQNMDFCVGREYSVPTMALTKEAQSFIDWVYQQTRVSDVETMRVVWKAIQQQALIWMVDGRRSIDLGFVRLFPIPYRKNWKEVLKAACPGIDTAIHIDDIPERNATMIKMGFAAMLKNGLLTAFHPKQRFVYWTIEAIEQDEWTKTSEAYERKKAARLGQVAYSKYWVGACRKAFGGVLEALRRWTKGLRIPCATVDDGSCFGGRVLVPYVPKGRIRPYPPPSGQVNAVLTDGDDEPIGHAYLESLLAPDGPVRKVRALQPEAAHLWDGGDKESESDVEEPDDGED